MSFVEFLRDIPAPAWGLGGAIVGVVGTLGASLLSNGASNKRFDRQLRHDAEQKAKDRAAEMRRKVYLDAAEQLVAVNAFLGQLASLDATDANAISAGMLDFFKATARVALVASENTRMKVAELSGAYGRLFMELMSTASEAHRLKIDINVNREGFASLNLERARLISAMRDANENVETKYKFESLSRSFERTADSIDEISTEFSELSEKHHNALIAYGVAAGGRISQLAELQAEVSALLRQEFDLDVNVERMKAQFRDQSSKAVDSGNEFFAHLSKSLNDRETQQDTPK